MDVKIVKAFSIANIVIVIMMLFSSTLCISINNSIVLQTKNYSCSEYINEILNSGLKDVQRNVSIKWLSYTKDFNSEIDEQIESIINNYQPYEEDNGRVNQSNFPTFFNYFTNVTVHPKYREQILTVLDEAQQRFDEMREQSEAIVDFYSSILIELVATFRHRRDLVEKKWHRFNRNVIDLNSTISKIERTLNCSIATTNQKMPGEASNKEIPPKSCYENQLRTSRKLKKDGILDIQTDTFAKPISVYCNNSFDGGGWTIILRRGPQKQQLDFRRTFEEYQRGFGKPNGEYWIGLQNLHNLTSSDQELYVRLADSQDKAFARYFRFRVGTAPDYQLTIGQYDPSSTGGDALSYHNKMSFSTYDSDRDRDQRRSCSAQSGGAGFWFKFCYHTNPTGVYPPKGLPKNTALHSLLEWRRWKGFHIYLTHFEMMIRPRY